MKKSLVILLVLALAFSAFAQGGTEQTTKTWPKYLAIGTAAAGGAYYPVGISIAEVINNTLGIETSAQVTGGAVENNTLIQDGTLDLAITMSATVYAAVMGQSPYTQPLNNVKAVFNGISEGIFHVVTLKKTGITKMTDLIGKNVVMGPAGGGAINMATAVWAEYGFSLADVKPTYVSYSDGVSALKDGKVDAVLVQSAAPASAVQELCATKASDVVIVPVDKAVAEKIVAKSPYYAYKTLPKSVYGVSEDALVIYQTNLIVCRADLDEDLVYQITKCCVENAAKIAGSNPSAKNFSREVAAINMPIELHPGALKYYKEAGLL